MSDISRRSMLKRSAGAMALAAGAGTPFLNSRTAYAQALADQELRTVGLSVTVQDRILQDFQAASGVGSVSGTAAVYPDTQAQILAGARDYDCWETIGERVPALTSTNNVIPIATSSLSNWDSIRPMFTVPDERWGAVSNQIVGQIWVDPEDQTELYMVPTVYNFDSIGYRSDLVEAEEANTWTSIFDRRFRGRTGINTDPLIAIGQAVMALNTLGELEAVNPGNPTVEEIDIAIDFLISKKREGQFRALWGDFGELVNLMASGEMIICDAWQPAVMAVKALIRENGQDCSYAVPREGYRGWSIGISMLPGTPNPDAVIAYADYWLSGPPSIIVSEQGYYSPTTNIVNVMDPDRYAFWYEGQPWVGAPDRGIMEGDLRDGGSLEERASLINYWHQWPDEYDYLIQRWDEFLNA